MLCAPHSRVSVQSNVAYSEVYFVSLSERTYAFKITVLTQGKSEKAVYLMGQKFADKVEWVNQLDEVIKSFADNLVPVPAFQQDGTKQLVAALPPDTEIL